MAQFDVHRYGKRGKKAKYLIDLQSDLLASIDTRIVAPAYEEGHFDRRIQGVHPAFELRNRTYVISMTEIAAVHRKELGERVDSVADLRREIIAAIDLLFTGI